MIMSRNIKGGFLTLSSVVGIVGEKVMNKTCGRKQLSNKAILKQYPDLQIVNINF